MKAYLVRDIESHTIIGFFFCKPNDFAYLLDEQTDPGSCEYIELLEPGGIFFEGGEAEPTQRWATTSYGDRDNWTPVSMAGYRRDMLAHAEKLKKEWES
jgi:hypothetical protein